MLRKGSQKRLPFLCFIGVIQEEVQNFRQLFRIQAARLEQSEQSDTEKEYGLPLGGQKTGISFINDTEGWITRSTHLAGQVISKTNDGGKTWSSQPNPIEESGMDSSIKALKPVFYNKNDGIIPLSLYQIQTSNFDNIFYYTRDGGKKWKSSVPIQSKERIEPLHYSFLDIQTGWVITSQCVLYSTKDGGESWIKIWENTDYKNISCLNFVSDQIGWALADNKIIKTINGGYSWEEIDSKINFMAY